mmetsp:Transcript_26561/g.41354  ORF Transcript_26561/g.41354 Transcript_26561/m.41354 type:complete len:84 (-) Transcript_26561:353-604(-)
MVVRRVREKVEFWASEICVSPFEVQTDATAGRSFSVSVLFVVPVQQQKEEESQVVESVKKSSDSKVWFCWITNVVGVFSADSK